MIPAVHADWYESLVDDLVAIHTEAVFNSRWELLVGYHTIGKRIMEETRLVWNARGNGATLSDLSKSTGIMKRDLYRAIQFYKKYPSLDDVPGGKNISWTKVVALLPKENEPKPSRNWNYYLPRAKALYADLFEIIDDTPPAVRDWLRSAPEEVK